jgi:hypothetical protein
VRIGIRTALALQEMTLMSTTNIEVFDTSVLIVVDQ